MAVSGLLLRPGFISPELHLSAAQLCSCAASLLPLIPAPLLLLEESRKAYDAGRGQLEEESCHLELSCSEANHREKETKQAEQLAMGKLLWGGS